MNFSRRGDGSDPETEFAATTVHEGIHGMQWEATTRSQVKAGEVRPFTTQSYVNQGLEVNSAYGIWTIQSGFAAGKVDAAAERAAEWSCQNGGPCK